MNKYYLNWGLNGTGQSINQYYKTIKKINLKKITIKIFINTFYKTVCLKT